MAHLVQQMAYVGAEPWHGLGNRLPAKQPIEVWAKSAGMDWTIQESPVRFMADSIGSLGTIHSFEDQKVLYRSDTKEALSVVSQRYQVVQPKEVLEFYRDLTDVSGYQLETAGVLKGGKKFWALAKTGQSTALKGNDQVRGYLLLATSCDGIKACNHTPYPVPVRSSIVRHSNWSRPRNCHEKTGWPFANKASGVRMPHPLDEALRKEQGGKIRNIPIRLLFNDPDLNFRAEYSLFDRTTGRPLCVGNGEISKRQTEEGIKSFLSFVIWELTEENPIVDLRVFRHRGFSASMFVLALAFGAFFGVNVLTPLWLQYNLGYTTTWAGMVVAWGGMLSVIFSPIAASLSNRVDPRWLIFIGCAWLGGDTLWRAIATSEMDYWSIIFPLFFMGVGMPMYYVPLTGLAMGSVNEEETASAAGLMNFIRTISGAFATSLVTTFWQDGRYIVHDQLSNIVDPTGEFGGGVERAPSLIGQFGREAFDMAVSGQSMMLSTNDLMISIAIVFFVSAFAIALAPKANGGAQPARDRVYPLARRVVAISSR